MTKVRVSPRFRLAAAAAGALLAAVLVQPGTVCADTVATNNDQLGYGGLTYAQVQARTSARLMIGAKVGSERALEDCTVTGSRNGGFLDNSGQNAGRVVVLSLYCGAKMAEPGKPGNSITEPEAQRVKRVVEASKRISEAYEEAVAKGETPWCADNFDRCANVCRNADARCSSALMKFLGL